MEHLREYYDQLHSRTNKFKSELHKKLAEHPLINKHVGDMASIFGLSRAAFICTIIVTVLAVLLRVTTVSFISTLIGVVFPLYKTNEALNTNNKKCKKSILCYWLIYFVIYQFERTVLALLPYISFYVFVKTAFLISCYSLQFKQSDEICTSVITFIRPHLAELKSFFGDGVFNGSKSTESVTDDANKEILYGVEVYIDSAELDLEKESSVVCQVTAIPPDSRKSFGIENTKFKTQVLIGKKSFSFKKTINVFPVRSLDGAVKIELKEKDTFTEESDSTVFLSGEMKLSDLIVASGDKAQSSTTKKNFKGDEVCSASLECALRVIKKST